MYFVAGGERGLLPFPLPSGGLQSDGPGRRVIPRRVATEAAHRAARLTVLSIRTVVQV